MKWQEVGCLLKIDKLDRYAQSHAMIPTPLLLPNNLLRVYFTSRDSNGIGRPRYTDFDPNSNFLVIKHSESYICEIGGPGTFDDNGLIVCSITKMPNNEIYMYYAGFELSMKIRYRIFTGLAISIDGGREFRRYSDVPILDRTDSETFFRGGPFVKKTNFGYEMYYVGGRDWIQLENSLKPVYSLQMTRSLDGINWGEPTEVFSPEDKSEHGFGRPFEFEWRERRFLYYSVRDSLRETYKLGYAEILNNEYIRKDTQFELFSEGKLVENYDLMYASFVHIDNDLYMLFNKREFGLDGIFLAKLIDLD